MQAIQDELPDVRCDVRCPAGPWPTVAEAGEASLSCRHRLAPAAARRELRRLAHAGDLRLTPRAAALVTSRPSGATTALLCAMLDSGALVLVRGLKRGWPAAWSTRTPPQDEPPAPSGPPETQKAWVRFRVLDDRTGEPLAGVRMLIREPSGLEREYVTRGDGMIEIHELSPGACDIVRIDSQPAFEVRSVESR